MKHTFVIAALMLSFCISAGTSQAVYWDATTHQSITTDGDHCVLTPDKAQKSATTVYTLNIDKTQSVNGYYFTYWNRYARCDELQFHAEHGTSLSMLKSWLIKVQRNRIYGHKLQGSYLTADGKLWHLINHDRWQLYDWPTMAAWGFLVKDVVILNANYTSDVYAAYTEHPARDLVGGPYGDYVQHLWHTTNALIPDADAIGSAPQSIVSDVARYGLGGTFGMFRFRNPCAIAFNQKGWMCKRLDMSFTKKNTCQVLGNTYTCDDGTSGDLNNL